MAETDKPRDTEERSAGKPGRGPMGGDRSKPLVWGLVFWFAVSLAIGWAAAELVGIHDLFIMATVPAMMAIAGALIGGSRGWLVRAIVFSGAGAVLQAAAVATRDTPWAAALLTFAVFYLVTVLSDVPGVGAASGLLGFAYMIAMLMGSVLDLPSGVAGTALGAGALGAAAGLAAVGLYRLRLAFAKTPTAVEEQTSGMAHAPRSGAALWRRVTDLHSRTVRFAIVRSLTLGVGAAVLATHGRDRPTAWAVVAVYSVLRPGLRDAVSRALVRAGATLAAVVVISAMAAVLPPRMVEAVAVIALVGGMAWFRRNPLIMQLGETLAVVALIATPSGDFTQWAIDRFLAVAGGSAIAIVILLAVMPNVYALFGGSSDPVPRG